MQSNWSLLVLHPLYSSIVSVLPSVAFALILLGVGFVLGSAINGIIQGLFKRIRVNDVLIATGSNSVVEKMGYHVDAGQFVGTLLKWLIIIFFFGIALEALGFQSATNLIHDIVFAYLSRILIATVILFGAMVLGHVVERAAVAAASEAGIRGAKVVGRFFRGVIVMLAILAVLIELEIATETAEMLFGGTVFAMALAFGLAIGFGSKDAVARYVDSLSRTKE